jgi:GH15 family glucan-1,4-alpha-glucosidase
MSSPLEDYALIGDGQTAALVNRDGSIDWLCWPRFDSDACLCALLGSHDSGRWLLAPEANGRSIRRRYENDTLVLETETTTDAGTVRVLDFMPLRKGDLSAVVRMVVGMAGSVAMHMELCLRFDYGAMPPWCEQTAEGLTAAVGPHRVTLNSPIPLTIMYDVASTDFVIAAGERHAFVLSYAPSD